MSTSRDVRILNAISDSARSRKRLNSFGRRCAGLRTTMAARRPDNIGRAQSVPAISIDVARTCPSASNERGRWGTDVVYVLTVIRPTLAAVQIVAPSGANFRTDQCINGRPFGPSPSEKQFNKSNRIEI